MVSIFPITYGDNHSRACGHSISRIMSGLIPKSTTCNGFYGVAMIGKQSGGPVIWDGDHTEMPTVTYHAWSKSTP